MSIKYLCLLVLLVRISEQDESIITLKPSSLDLLIGKQDTITLSVSNASAEAPVIIKFLYDGETYPKQFYVDPLPNVTVDSSKSVDIPIKGRREGHLVLTVESMNINVSSNKNFILIDVARSKFLNILIQIVGWIYFAAWSISFYPQIYLNFKRRSVVGLNFDFLALNILGHSCYCIFNLVLYTSTNVQQQYYDKHPHGVLPVLLNDVIFSCHAVFACTMTIVQCLVFHHAKQRVSYSARGIWAGLALFLIISCIVTWANRLSSLNLIYFFSYVKLAITIMKYVPQAWMNYKRKSTEGWSIGNILLDFTGGVLSLLQMFFLSINYNDWSSIFGSPTKFGLGFFTVLFDILFISQHYCLYRHASENSVAKEEINEHSPIIGSRGDGYFFKSEK